MPEPTTPLSERPWEDVGLMLGVDEALGILLDSVEPLGPVDVPLLDALGSVLVDDVVAGGPVPPFRNSAMDGYAVRAADTAGASFDRGIRLEVVGTAAAGGPCRHDVGPGIAVRVMTGAVLPERADAVVRFEETDEGTTTSEAASVVVFHPAKPGDNVREAGEDIPAGMVLLERGRLLRPAELGLLAAANRPKVRVHRRPRVAILSTGDEVVDPGEPLAAGQIRNSNSFTLAAMAKSWGAEVQLLGVARDREDVLAGKLLGADAPDLLVTSGGVSVGDYDLVKDVLRRHGEIAVWQVRMKPGKPLAFGRLGGTPLIGLPGNPVAAAVSFEVFGRPVVRRLQARPTAVATIAVRAGEAMDNRGMRRHYVRARLLPQPDGPPVAVAAGDQGAGVLTSLARADALAIVPETTELVEAGTELRAIPLAGDSY